MTVLLAIGLSLVHVLASRLRILDAIPRSRWLSAAGGASVAYVFIHIFPELSEHQEAIAQTETPILQYLEYHVYLLALSGFGVFYGLERAAQKSRHQNRKQTNVDVTGAGIFWLHILSFSAYNALIGYLLIHREETGLLSLFLFFLAMALHFTVNDHGLWEHHKNSYDRVGRWVLAGSVITGWGIGRVVEVNEAAIATLFAFLAGGIILNVIKEELPEERESRFWAFALGSIVYSLLLLAQ